MEPGDGPRQMTTGAAKVAPPNPTERLCEALDALGTTVDNIQSAAHRTHEKTYGEYQYQPQAEADLPDMGGRVGEMLVRVQAIHGQASQALELVESLESKG